MGITQMNRLCRGDPLPIKNAQGNIRRHTIGNEMRHDAIANSGGLPDAISASVDLVSNESGRFSVSGLNRMR